MESENYHVCIGLLRFCDMKIKCCFEGVYTQERVDVSHEALLQCICWEKFKIFNWIPERTACGTTSPCSVQRIYFVSCFLWIQLKNTNKGLHVPLWQAHIDNKNLIIPICGEASPFRSPFHSSFFFSQRNLLRHIFVHFTCSFRWCAAFCLLVACIWSFAVLAADVTRIPYQFRHAVRRHYNKI